MGQENKKISFMCIGVQKAGTTSLHEILNQHPDINLPIFKETHFFSDNTNFSKGMDYYFDNSFQRIKEHQILGEIDPEYIFFDESLYRIAKYFKKIKIIVILRNPTERAYSHFNMTLRRGYENLDFLEALKAEHQRHGNYFEKTHFSYVNRGLYYKQLSKLFSVFRRENIKIILYENYKNAPEKVVSDICNFIDVEPINFNFNINKNKASTVKSNVIRDFVYKDNLLKKLGGKLFKSEKLKLRIMQAIDKVNLKNGEIEKLSLNDKKYICRNYFIHDIEKTEKLLKLNLDFWKYGL